MENNEKLKVSPLDKDLNQQLHEAPGDRTVSADEFKKAHDQADKDIAADPEVSAHSPNDDLDEAETARLGDQSTGLV